MHPGTGYVAAEDGSAIRVRADYWTDTQIRATATQYQFIVAPYRPITPLADIRCLGGETDRAGRDFTSNDTQRITAICW
jgi:hypothetical protein